MYKLKWKKIYKTKYFFKDRFGNIELVIELEHCEWHITDNIFTKERADYLAASMEELTGIKHYVIEVEYENKADVVYGSRFTGENPHRVHYFWHYIGNKFITLLSNMFTNLNLTDIESCYKLFKTDIIKQITINSKGFSVEPELTYRVSRLNCKVFEVGISYAGRSYSEGKKIKWKDGVFAVLAILRYGLFRK